jgi:HEPN domain-containing protein
MRTETDEWVAKAEADFGSTELEFNASKPNFDATCFHAHQCAEKYLKALLQEHALAFPKTHDLELLLELLLPLAPSLGSVRSAAQALAGHSVEFRYPGMWADEPTALHALENCRAIRSAVRALLGLAS